MDGAILDRVREAVAFFAAFIPVYDEAAALAGRGRCVGIALSDLHGPDEELHGLDPAALRADADTLSVAVERTENHRHNLDRYWETLSGWQGGAADVAGAHHDRLAERADRLVRDMAAVPGALAGAADAIQDALGRYTEHILDLSDSRCGGLTAGEVRAAIERADSLALGDFVDEFDARRAAYDAHTGNLRQEIQAHQDILLAQLPAASGPAPTVTIEHPSTAISLSTLDHQGRIALSVVDGVGQPRTYELDFGGTTAAATTGGEPGGGAAPGAPATPPASAPRLPPTLFAWTTARPVERLHPDEDGRVVIRDGKVLITVEADDDADELTIMLDDGAGNQTVYRVDYRDPAMPKLRQGIEPR